MAVHWLVGISCALGMAVSFDMDGPGVGVREDMDGQGVGVGEDRQGSLGMGAEQVPITCLPGEAAAMVVTPPQTHHSCIQKGAQHSQWMFGNCLLYNCQSLVLHLQSLYLFCYALSEQPDPFYSFLSLLLIHLICPCQQSKYLACFTPL